MPACNLRRLRVTDQFGAVGWGVVMKDQPKESSNVEGSSYRIGVVKYFTVKWRRYYIQFIDASAPELEALRPLKLPSLRDAKELAESLAISLTHGDIQLSRSATDRHWLDPEDMQIYVLSDLKVWERPDELHQRKPPSSPGEKEKSWYACSICGYQVPKGSIRWARDACCQGSGHPNSSELKGSPRSCPTPEEDDDRQQALRRFHSALGTGDTLMKDSDEDYPPLGGLASTGIGEQIKTEPEEQADSKDEESVQPLQCCNCRSVFHGDCLLPHEKLLPPDGMDEGLQFRNLDMYLQGVATAVPELLPKGCHDLHAFSKYCCEPLGTYPTNWDKLSLVKLFGCLEYHLPSKSCRYCPVCLRAWSTVWCDDMVQCDGCEFWVHAKCDNFTCKEQFTELTDKDVKYFCPICRDSTSKSKYIRALDLLKALDKSHLFSEPVNAAFAPLYLRVVKKPMNLRKMRQKAEAHMYPSVQDFVDDFDQIIANAKLFNMPNTQTYKIAEQFEKNGKLVLERYLLKVAGAAGVAKIVNESPSSPALPIDVASIEGSDKSARTRRSTRITTKPGTDGPSPYKQRLKKPRKAPSSSTRLLLSPSISPASLIITDPRILDLIALVPLCNRLISVVYVCPPVPTGIPLWSPCRAQFHSSLYRIPYLFTVVGFSLNAVLSRVAGLPDKKSYHCPGCNRCPYCAQICSKSLSNDPTELAAPKMMCVKCGIIWHSKCRDRWVKKTASSDKLGDWLWDDKFIMCDQCAAEQYKVSFNASRRCLACNGTIIDGTASKKTCSSKILCLICGGRWHSKCIPEFRDLTMISIPDYICAQCLADTPMDELPRRHTSNDQTPTTTASDTEIAKSLSSELISIRNRHAACAERSRMLDALAGRHNSGLLRKLPKHLEPALLQTMALAGATSGGNAGTTPSVIGEDCEDWLVRTMGQDVFMPRRATKVSGKTSPTVSTPQDALIAQRLLAARDILQWIDTQDSSTDHTGHDSSPSPVRAETVMEEPLALVQRSWWLQQGRDPAVLLLKIIHKTLTSVDKGYIGAFLLLTESSAVPSHWNGDIESQCAHTRLGVRVVRHN
ncbi:bromodomain-containing protein, putative [Perkinsus marinus ATCC 50983]|uniref:Bromodomain-containing protein, putative n=1 Tax=Perkinsus marinus (strain ATCC 50983 / TXsc) TaxID=423536 RepID=C5LY71_PERM5|nr:bromodomain-containing protein, putative [Perkinsus marinus ATCC 50983]EEQ98401.1 bromodomain-containing protein, putative [Perkinsus marinus ATCC 50983]|eukprot:XP_002765684.1 bromodomain-containing protein, putative [Perkinsus marinus ATCC 50983]